MGHIRFALVVVPLLLSAQADRALAQSVAWSRAINGAAGAVAYLGDGQLIARGMAADAAGNVVLTGTTINGTRRDLLTTRLQAGTGTVTWQQTIAGASGRPADAHSVALDAAGNAVVAGLTGNASNTDIKVVKYAAADGRVLWERTIDSGRDEGAYFVAVDGAGDALVAARAVNAAGNFDVRVLKLSGASGASAWDRTFDGGGDDLATDLGVDGAGNVVVSAMSINAAGNSDMRVLKFAGAGGALLWDRAIDSGGTDEPYAIAIDSAGNVVVTGYSAGAAGADMRTLKLAAGDGAVLWERTYDGGREDYGMAAGFDPFGNVYVAAQSQAADGHRVFRTFKYAGANGASLWDRTFDGGVNDFVYQLAVDASGGPVVVGSSTVAGGRTDWKVVAYAAADGAVRWEHGYGGTAGAADDAYAVLPAAGGVVVAGIATESGSAVGVLAMKIDPPSTGTGVTAAGDRVNVALSSAGATAFASSTYGIAFPAAAAINGDRAGRGWGNGSGWNDGTAGAWPDWLQVTFDGLKTIDQVVVYSLQDNVANPVEPGDGTTFSSYGLVDFTVEGWTGSSWVTLGRVSGNNRVKRTIDFAPVAVDRIFLHVTRSLGGYSHVVEIEAWGTAAPPPASNVALASAGASALASSVYNGAFSAAAAINGDRAGRGWGNQSGWNDGTIGTWPDWLQVQFDGFRTVDRVVVYSLQDNPASPVEPGDSLTFSSYGLVDFTVEGWTGATWIPLGRVSGNNLVKRTLAFPPVAIDRIHLTVTRSLGGFSHVTEIEAWGR